MDIKVLDQKNTDKYSAYHGDCIDILQGFPNDSIHYSIFSPPFSSLFTYSNSKRDMGNCTDQEFNEHFKFFVPELYRIMMPGRLVSIHCSDIPAMKERDGYIGLKDLPGDIIRCFQKTGFIYHSRVLITKDPLLEAVRTKSLGLMHKQLCKDSCRCRQGLPDYIITMMKSGENPKPVIHPNGFEEYIGENSEPDEKKNKDSSKNKFSHHIWRKYAANVWDDINQTNTLNVRLAREKNDERHLCPLQLDAIARCLELWSNPGDVVLSPFMGVGSEGYESIKRNRRFIGIELKKSYYDISIKNLESVSNSILRQFNFKK